MGFKVIEGYVGRMLHCSSTVTHFVKCGSNMTVYRPVSRPCCTICRHDPRSRTLPSPWLYSRAAASQHYLLARAGVALFTSKHTKIRYILYSSRVTITICHR